MKLLSAFALIVSLTGCASGPAPAPAPAPAGTPTPSNNLYPRIPAEIGAFKLTERAIVRGVPTDSLFRFSDGSRTILTVIIYEVAPDVRVDADSQKWTMREGEKFKEVQEIRVSRWTLSEFTPGFSDTTRFAAGQRVILEHRIATPVRFPSGNVSVDMQYLYLIGGKFVKVRATIPHQDWQKSNVWSFPRELALRLAREP